MRIAPLVMAVVGLASAGAAMAADRPSDVDYMKAARCRGIASGLAADTSALDAYLKAEGRSRVAYVLDKAAQEQDRGRRDAKSASRTAAAAAELSGPCQAYRS